MPAPLQFTSFFAERSRRARPDLAVHRLRFGARTYRRWLVTSRRADMAPHHHTATRAAQVRPMSTRATSRKLWGVASVSGRFGKGTKLVRILRVYQYQQPHSARVGDNPRGAAKPAEEGHGDRSPDHSHQHAPCRRLQIGHGRHIGERLSAQHLERYRDQEISNGTCDCAVPDRVGHGAEKIRPLTKLPGNRTECRSKPAGDKRPVGSRKR